MISSVFKENILDWMGSNLFLAVIPVILSFIIFSFRFWEKKRYLGALRILAIAIFFIFLPNAPYTVTDLIHLIRQIRDYRYFKLTDTQILYGLIPQYAIFIFIGLSCYTISFRKFLVFICECGVKRSTLLILKFLNPLFMALGVFLGREYRYSSWDIVLHFISMLKILWRELGDVRFYCYIFYFYFLIVILYECLSLFYRSVFPALFTEKNSEISKAEPKDH